MNINYLTDDAAATIIQRAWLRYSTISEDKLEHYRELCAKALDASSKMPKMGAAAGGYGGKTAVYFPMENRAVVLKYSQERCSDRLDKMLRVRAILKEQNCTQIVVPSAIICGDFLVERRVPASPSEYYNINLYINNPEKFDRAVEELARLFFTLSIDDLVTSAWGKRVPRFDNLMFCSNGQVALIDLERLSLNPSEKATELAHLDLVHFFPYHTDLIAKIAKRSADEFNERAKQAKSYFDRTCSAHYKFLSSNLSFRPFEIPQHVVLC